MKVSVNTTPRSPFAALLTLHDVSKELQKTYRDGALRSQQTVYDLTMEGIDKARKAQRNGFILQMVGAAVQFAAGAVMLGMSTSAFSKITKQIKNATSALKGAPKPSAANAAPGTSTEVINAQIKPPRPDAMLIQSRVTAINATSQGLSAAFTQTGSYVTRLGELEQQEKQAKATRESQVQDLRNSQMHEHGANAREIRDSIRNIIPNRSFHA